MCNKSSFKLLTKNLHFSFEMFLCLTLVEMDFTIFQSKALLSNHPCIKMLEKINKLFVKIIVLWEDIMKTILGF